MIAFTQSLKNRNQMRFFPSLCLSVLFLCFSAPLVCHASDTEEVAVTEHDHRAANEKFSFYLKGRKLHSLKDRAPDGTLGFKIELDLGQRSGAKPCETLEQTFLREDFCQAEAVVIARVLNSKAFMAENETNVFTKTKFHVEEVLRARSSPGGRNLSLVSVGGEVAVGNEKYRVTFNGNPEYRKGTRYLLFLPVDSKTGEAEYAGNPIAFEIRSDKVFPSNKRYFGAAPGTPMLVLRKRLDSLINSQICQP